MWSLLAGSLARGAGKRRPRQVTQAGWEVGFKEASSSVFGERPIRGFEDLFETTTLSKPRPVNSSPKPDPSRLVPIRATGAH